MVAFSVGEAGGKGLDNYLHDKPIMRGVGYAAMKGARDGAGAALLSVGMELLAARIISANAASAGTQASAGTSSELAATEHGEMRLADPTRLGEQGAGDAVANATRTFSQRDGARVFVQELNGKFNVVVQGERGVITTFKNLSQKSLDRRGITAGSRIDEQYRTGAVLFCGNLIVKLAADPLSLTIHLADGEEQALFCHYRCLKRAVDSSVPLYPVDETQATSEGL